MHRSPEAWRRIVVICGVAGLILAGPGYWVFTYGPHAWHSPGLLAFYSGFALVIAAIVIWYRYVPPKPPAPEEPEPVDDSDVEEHDS